MTSPYHIYFVFVPRIGGGVLAQRTRYTYYEKCILNPFQNVKKFRQKILSVYLNNLCSPTKFCDQNTFFMVCVKKDKKWSRK
jgi:hypothetical protein